jgi:hypothetical protein
VVPTLRFFVSGEFEDDDFLKRGTLQDFMTPMNGEKSCRMLLKTGWNQLFVLIQLRFVASPFAREDNVSGHFFSSAASIR